MSWYGMTPQALTKEQVRALVPGACHMTVYLIRVFVKNGDESERICDRCGARYTLAEVRRQAQKRGWMS